MQSSIKITCHFMIRWLERVEGKEAEIKKLRALNPNLKEKDILTAYLKWHGIHFAKIRADMAKVAEMARSQNNHFRVFGKKYKIKFNGDYATTLYPSHSRKPRKRRR